MISTAGGGFFGQSSARKWSENRPKSVKSMFEMRIGEGGAGAGFYMCWGSKRTTERRPAQALAQQNERIEKRVMHRVLLPVEKSLFLSLI